MSRSLRAREFGMALAIVLATACMVSASQPLREFHEAEVGWATRQLAEALDIPIRENGFADAIRRLVKSAAKGEVPTFDDTSAMIRLGLEGVTPGRTTESWIARVDLRSPLAAGDPENEVVSDLNLRRLTRLIANGVKNGEGADPKHVALMNQGLLLLNAESDFLEVSVVLNLLRREGFLQSCLLDEEQQKALSALAAEMSKRHSSFTRTLGHLVSVVQTCRVQSRQPTAAEEQTLIEHLDELRSTGVISQAAWWNIARTSHAVLRLMGVPAEQEINTKFAVYLREWEASLPECNAKRWLRQAITAGRDLEPQRFIDGTQARPAVQP